ncbi:hypothetical protein [Caminibacter mediatlanticus]|uniref:Uncharacterized protein n=1 Tax=Caminibacter mediatlanticus TB-2 TaxID=391592 RepID=A0AAI9AHK6_9BACT|nr:hypothetical protein [Caminibacter mediatlanticus]EDM24341.1 hypothetical protein CMTB2_02458 [Caminibacter mediatlanticus TB-2]
MQILMIILIIYGIFAIAEIMYIKKLEKRFKEKNLKLNEYEEELILKKIIQKA